MEPRVIHRIDGVLCAHTTDAPDRGRCCRIVCTVWETGAWHVTSPDAPDIDLRGDRDEGARSLVALLLAVAALEPAATR